MAAASLKDNSDYNFWSGFLGDQGYPSLNIPSTFSLSVAAIDFD